MIPGQRCPALAQQAELPAEAAQRPVVPAEPGAVPAPGDFYLDPAIPERERMTLSCGDWSAPATHVWTGLGWARLRVGPVRPVPS